MKTKIKFLSITLFVTLLLAGCSSLYTATVTLTDAEDAVMKQWATLHNDHKTTEDIDRRVMDAHGKFNQAKLAAAAALRAYADGGDKANYLKALDVARAAIDPLFSILQPLLTPNTTKTLKAKVATANAP